MTVSANATFDLSRDSIIETAFSLCGVGDPDVEQMALGSNLLNMGLKALQNEGVILRTLERYPQALAAGTASYTAPLDTLDIESPAYISLTSGIDYPLTTMSRVQYMQLTDKTVQGPPTLLYVERTGTTVTLILYPVPDTTVLTITYPRIRLCRDMDTGTVTPDLPSKYLQTVVYMLATDLSLHLGHLDRYERLESKYRMAKGLAVSDDSERGPIRIIPLFGGRWR